MKPEFRENVYTAFATVQLANMAKSASGMARNLRMPTQMQESTLGYDARMKVKGKIVYLQYKVSDFLFATSARQYNYYNAPYFRFKVKTDEVNGFIQHNALRDLQIYNPNAMVRYCAPMFYTMQELADIHFSTASSPAQSVRRAHSLSGTSAYGVLDHSALLSPLMLDEVDEDSVHVMTYSASSSKAISFSFPEEGRVESFEDVIENAAGSSRTLPLHAALDQMISEMREAIYRSIKSYPPSDEVPPLAKPWNYSERHPIAEVRRLSDILGVQPLIWVRT